MRLNRPYPSHILPAMRKTAFLLAILLIGALPAAAQTTEFGVLFGGSKRVTDDELVGPDPINDGFSFSNNSFELYYALQIDPGTMFKIKAGRIEGPVGFPGTAIVDGETRTVRVDAEGEVQHIEGLIEYRFSEPFGSAGLFAGIGAYRHEAPGFDSATDYGFAVGVTADFPLTRRYGVILDGTYHFTKHEFSPRYLTVSGGLRFGF